MTMGNALIKNKLNIVGRCFVKNNAVGGEILSYLPDVPMWGRLCDYVFFLTIPARSEKYAPAYCRLQDKSRNPANLPDLPVIDWDDFDQAKEHGFVREKADDILVCAPRSNVLVDFSQIVVVANIPEIGKNHTSVFIKKKRYEKNKSELAVEVVENTINISENKIEIIGDVISTYN